MFRFLAQRILAVFPVLFIVAVIVFLILRLTPGDPAAVIAGNSASVEDIVRIRKSLGLEEPLLTQFFIWIKGVVTGDLGHSFYFRLPVTELIAQRLEPSAMLALMTILMSVSIAVPLGVLAAWDGEPGIKPDLTFPDPRDAALGFRILVPAELAAKTAKLIGAELLDEDAYEAHRIATGVPRGGIDFAYGDAFPHESNMDRLKGVDFDKGCYVGQEVVSRMQHRGTARTRIVGVALDGGIPEPGSEIRAADRPIGTMGSSANGQGLALIRTDRATDALDAGAPFLAGDQPIHFSDVDAVRAFAPKKTLA